MITCQELADFLADYITNELSTEQQTEFERHLRVCPPCIAYLNNYRQTIEISKEVMTGDADQKLANIPEDLIKAIVAARQRH